MMGYGYGMEWGGWIAMAVFWIAIITLVIWGVSRAFPTDRNPSRDSGISPGESAVEILDRRYAAGEIDDDRYRTMRATLAADATDGR